MDESELKELKDLFNKLDTNKDGELTVKSIILLFKYFQMKEIRKHLRQS